MPRIVLAFFAMLLLPITAFATQTWWMRGGNWADGRDNYQDGWIIPSGLTASASTTDTQNKTVQIVNDIKGIGGQVVRIGINPPSVADATWWARIQTMTDTAVANGCHVILGCWESRSGLNGIIDDYAAWKTMWQKVDARYSGNWSVWFEPINEPYGYSATDLKNVYKDFLSFIAKTDERIILPGRSYSEWVGDIANDAAFNSCKFGVHMYGYWFNVSEAQWKTELNNRVAGYWDRALITEMGAPATTGLNFGASSSDQQIKYIRGVTQRARETTIGIIYWPTHRDGDSYSLFVNTTNGGVNNVSLKDRLRYGWNY